MIDIDVSKIVSEIGEPKARLIENEDEKTTSARYTGEETGTFTFYQCEDCGYLEITSDASYCPGCGKKIKYKY